MATFRSHLGDGAYLVHENGLFWFCANSHENKLVALGYEEMLTMGRQLAAHFPTLAERMVSVMNDQMGISE